MILWQSIHHSQDDTTFMGNLGDLQIMVVSDVGWLYEALHIGVQYDYGLIGWCLAQNRLHSLVYTTFTSAVMIWGQCSGHSLDDGTQLVCH